MAGGSPPICWRPRPPSSASASTWPASRTRRHDMTRFRLERRQETPVSIQILLPLAAIVVALVLCSFLVWLTGADVIEAYSILFLSTFQSGYDIEDTLVKAAPLLFTGLAVAVAFRAKFWNLRGEGHVMAVRI